MTVKEEILRLEAAYKLQQIKSKSIHVLQLIKNHKVHNGGSSSFKRFKSGLDMYNEEEDYVY